MFLFSINTKDTTSKGTKYPNAVPFKGIKVDTVLQHFKFDGFFTKINTPPPLRFFLHVRLTSKPKDFSVAIVWLWPCPGDSQDSVIQAISTLK